MFQPGRRVPVVTQVVDTPERIAAAFGIVNELADEHGLVASEMVPAMQYVGPRRRGDFSVARHDY